MITIGADPELFLANSEGFVSAHGLIPGDKYKPHPVTSGAIQVDGVAAEFNINPVHTLEDFTSSIKTVMNELKSYAPEYNFMSVSTVDVDIESLPPDVRRLSCAADIDPYVQDLNAGLDEATPFRSAGGHIHIGGIYTKAENKLQQFNKGARLARLMDKYVGVYSLLWDTDNLRRSTYGKAGAYRFKKYGIEYRALSNAWLFNDKLVEFVFNQTQEAVKALEAGEDVDTYLYRGLINDSVYNAELFDSDETAQYVKEVVNG